MKKILILFLIVLLGNLFLPSVSLAGGKYQAGSYTIEYEGLVPCGKCVKISHLLPADKETAKRCNVLEDQPTNVRYIPCQLCHLFVLVKGIIDFFLLYIVFPIATLLLIIGGGMFFLYAEDPRKVDQAKNLLKSVIIGLLVIFSAWLVINTFFTVIGFSEFGLKLTGPDKWFQINCPISL